MLQVLNWILFFFLFFCVIFTVGFFWTFMQNLRIEQAKSQSNSQNVLLVYVEQVNGVHYLYEKLTNNFICQSEDVKELAKLAQERYPEYKIKVIQEN